MAFLAAINRYRQLSSVPIQLNCSYNSWNWCCHFVYTSSTTRWLSSSRSESTRTEFPVENAYNILGVLESSSFAEIKASFRKLAKETHPDLAESRNASSASKRFIQILAAYEILSDSEKKAHYDQYLLSQRKLMEEHSRQDSKLYMYRSHMTTNKQMEVVEWLKWYRFAINDLLSEKKVIVGTGYFDVLQADFYSAIHAAYYGPVIESIDLLPDRFEAEERSVYETPEVLHLVSGRDVFGMVCLANNIPRLSFNCNEKLTSSASVDSGTSWFIENANKCMNPYEANDPGISQTQTNNITSHDSDIYRDLELHVSGRVVAMATRVPPKTYPSGIEREDAHDCIYVFLTSEEGAMHTSRGFSVDSSSDGIVGSRILLGTITGLGTSPEEGSCFVYNSSGKKTHVIMKHRTLLVKHLHWYQLGDEVSVCECRCSRAKLPPSKFWLFEPRCGMHDIGGWYIETFGRDKKGRTVPSQRYWDGFDVSQQFDQRLHPAMYLTVLAYRTLDLEEAKRRKWTVRNLVEVQLFRILSWCKKLV
ncbi:hypothetical protein ACOSP7_023271 [Xanthoceras sorbifolium]|uniref:J domain-containing protein n=1 Tax=Xanthoceras sorbifolium TaxID=99658 RepID=A0ABQ8HQV4_9ROSI|nr:hypothetical protein JRO89_XS08G0213900 [Xanthoceras sorbifolium]